MKLGLAAVAAALVIGGAGCGGGDDGGSGASGERGGGAYGSNGGGGAAATTAPTTPTDQTSERSGPSIDEIVAVARKNAGYAGCKEVEPGALQRGTHPEDPETIQGILCDQQQTAHVFVYDSEAKAAAYAAGKDRPVFVNGPLVLLTGEAYLAKQYDEKAAAKLPQDIVDYCGCGRVVP